MWRTVLDKPLATALKNCQQFIEMQDNEHFEIGSHTCSHQRLNGDEAQDALHHEIVHSKALLEEQTGRPVDLFCLPNGDYTSPALDLVRRHYLAAVTTRRVIIRVDTLHNHEMSRFGMHHNNTHHRRQYYT